MLSLFSLRSASLNTSLWKANANCRTKSWGPSSLFYSVENWPCIPIPCLLSHSRSLTLPSLPTYRSFLNSFLDGSFAKGFFKVEINKWYSLFCWCTVELGKTLVTSWNHSLWINRRIAYVCHQLSPNLKLLQNSWTYHLVLGIWKSLIYQFVPALPFALLSQWSYLYYLKSLGMECLPNISCVWPAIDGETEAQKGQWQSMEQNLQTPATIPLF